MRYSLEVRVRCSEQFGGRREGVRNSLEVRVKVFGTVWR